MRNCLFPRKAGRQTRTRLSLQVADRDRHLLLRSGRDRFRVRAGGVRDCPVLPIPQAPAGQIRWQNPESVCQAPAQSAPGAGFQSLAEDPGPNMTICNWPPVSRWQPGGPDDRLPGPDTHPRVPQEPGRHHPFCPVEPVRCSENTGCLPHDHRAAFSGNFRRGQPRPARAFRHPDRRGRADSGQSWPDDGRDDLQLSFFSCACASG